MVSRNLITVICFALMTPVISHASFVREKVRLETASGSLDVQLALPEKRAATSLPVMMIFGGFEEAGKVLDLFEREEPLILASFDYPYEGPRQLGFFNALAGTPQMRAAVMKTAEGIRALTGYLRTRSDVDPARVAILGASFGSPFAAQAAARDETISYLVLVHGFAQVPETLEHRLDQVFSRRWGAFSSAMASSASWLLTTLLAPPEPAEDLRELRPTQKVLVLEAAEDSFVPKASRDALWNAVQVSDARHQAQRRILPGDHIQPGAKEELSNLQKITTQWLREQGFYLNGTPLANSSDDDGKKQRARRPRQ